MGLRLKFNLILIAVFLVGYIGSLLFVDELMKSYARKGVLHSAELMLESVQAVRHYTSTEVKPLLIGRLNDTFLPQSVPSYAVQRTLAELHTHYPDYSYKDAVLNPTNPRDRAEDWEADVVKYFKEHPDEKRYEGVHESATGSELYLAHPIRITDPNCLSCHTTPSMAPASLIKMYGPDNGFGWQLNDVIGVQVMTVPMSLPLHRAHNIVLAFAGILGGVFLTLLAVANVILYVVVIRPVRTMADNAEKISTGAMSTAELQIEGKDEIATLARAFNRMHRSLANAMKMIEKLRGGSTGTGTGARTGSTGGSGSKSTT